MKNILILTLSAATLLLVGSLYAVNTPVDVESLELATISGLPTSPLLTLLEEASTGITCKRDIQCPDVYDPVTCSNGVTYSNSCYAFAACATGCSGGGVLV